MSIIAKYKFNKSIYENLIPEFNEGYTGYTISDEVHTLITEQDMLTGYINLPTGLEKPEELTNFPDAMISDFFNVTPNTIYGISYLHVIWYDVNKNYISHLEWSEKAPEVVISPENAAYVRICRRLAKRKDAYFGYVIRTIECDTLPTLMRFGSDVGQDSDYQSDNRVESLLEINALNTDNLTSCIRMFKFCKNLKNVSCDINIRNITTLHDIFASIPITYI